MTAAYITMELPVPDQDPKGFSWVKCSVSPLAYILLKGGYKLVHFTSVRRTIEVWALVDPHNEGVLAEDCPHFIIEKAKEMGLDIFPFSSPPLYTLNREGEEVVAYFEKGELHTEYRELYGDEEEQLSPPDDMELLELQYDS